MENSITTRIAICAIVEMCELIQNEDDMNEVAMYIDVIQDSACRLRVSMNQNEALKQARIREQS